MSAALRLFLGIFFYLLNASAALAASELSIAVAANFKPTLEQLVPVFEADAGVKVQVSAGSTGALYAQIRHGAPFDIFMSADADRPVRLESEQRTIPGTRSTYALGRLVLWVPGANDVSAKTLAQINFPVAIANPKLAPYGSAAVEVLKSVRRELPTLLRANNVAQATSFVATGNAKGGFLPLSHMRLMDAPATSYWTIPSHYHSDIDQQMVVLKGANPAYTQWLTFLRSAEAKNIIADAGYLSHGASQTASQKVETGE